MHNAAEYLNTKNGVNSLLIYSRVQKYYIIYILYIQCKMYFQSFRFVFETNFLLSPLVLPSTKVYITK